MSKFFSMKWSDPECSNRGHSKDCTCKLICEGNHPLTYGLKYEGKSSDKDSQMAEVGAYINSNLALDDQKQWVRIQRDPEQDYLRLQVPTDSTVKILPSAPISETFNWSYPVHLGSMGYKVDHAMKKADIRYLRKRFPGMSLSWSDMQRHVWSEPYDNDPPPLQWEIIRQWSTWRMAFGRVKGRLPVVAAMENLYPYKASNARLQMARKPAPDRAKEAIKHAPEALNIMYKKFKVLPKGDVPAVLSFQPLRNMYLGSSGGVNVAPHYTIPVPKCSSIHVSARGKKIDTFEADLLAILDFIRTGKEPPCWWNVTEKNENFFDFVKRMSDEEYSKWRNKLRVFIIPSSIYVLIEKLTAQLRMLRERGWVIQIGHRWSHGGSDRLAQCLAIDIMNCFKPLCWEGDVKNFDQSVLEYFLNLYSSFDMAYYDKDSPDYPIFEMLNRWLTKNLIYRVTHLMGEIWADIEGGVPSGIYRTSNMDSWVMSLYYFLFCVWALHNAPEEHRERLEEILHDLVRFIVYGDDHNGNPGDDPLAQTYFGGVPFAKFMQDHFGVLVRDLKYNMPFCSKTYKGWITSLGLTFLRHQHVINPLKASGDPRYADQCTFLPFRESREFIVRAIWGRETKERDELDVIMSCVGHAYGTYGSNQDAYERLCLLYEELLWTCDVAPGQVMADVVKRMSVNDMKKLRQMGITTDQLLAGFPTWETITEKNTLDWVYQDITNRPIEDDAWENSDLELAFN